MTNLGDLQPWQLENKLQEIWAMNTCPSFQAAFCVTQFVILIVGWQVSHGDNPFNPHHIKQASLGATPIPKYRNNSQTAASELA